ncbi:MAG: carbohydrate ABC transporter substrate-binding protein [Alphaproteobacteria bacterium]|nr:carbohydrate ABC transporter substrate-binding protein [Alphaproteobacteria bacterium]
MKIKALSRRQFLANTALATTAAIAAPYVRGAHAAGKLSIGFWDHWVPGANDTMTKLCNEWAAKEKVDVAIDYITSQGDKNLLTIAAEEQARSGHDILQMPSWYPLDKAESLEPVDDIVQKAIADNGKVSAAVEYLGKANGHWVGVPATNGSQVKPPCGRISLLKKFADLDVVKMYPAGAAANQELADKWTWDAFLDAATKCAKGGSPFGMGLGQTSDSVDFVGSVFASHGAVLVDQEGNITVKSDAVKQVLEWFKKLAPSLPNDTYAYDDASNNKILISGKSALIMNPPSAWAVAKRDNLPVAEDCWTFQTPKGPKGRFAPGQPYFWALWNFSQNKPAAKSLLAHLSQKSSIEPLVASSFGYDIPAYAGCLDFKTWLEVEPPKGTVYNYPPRGETIVSIAAAPAPPKIANQIYTQATMPKMIAKVTQEGQSIDQAIAWAEQELEGFMRT